MTAAVNSGWPVIGHEWAIAHLSRSLAYDRVRHAYLFTGPGMIGKTTLARVFAASLNCRDAHAPCGTCRTCTLILKDGHPDVSIVEAGQAGGQLKIEQVRDLQQTLALRPYEARYRVAVLRRFHEANPAAANALLKTLEEPPPGVILILTADAADLLLPTIVSRCQPLPLRPLPVEVVRAALMTRGAPPDTAQTLAQISGGRIGWAIRALADPAELAQRAEWLDLLETALQGTRRERFALVEKLSLEKTGLQTMLDFWVGYWRDALLIASGSRAPITNYDRQAALQALAERAGMGAVQHALDATRRTSQHLNKNVNTRLALEVLMLDYPLP